jgi:hypothetical protein
VRKAGGECYFVGWPQQRHLPEGQLSRQHGRLHISPAAAITCHCATAPLQVCVHQQQRTCGCGWRPGTGWRHRIGRKQHFLRQLCAGRWWGHWLDKHSNTDIASFVAPGALWRDAYISLQLVVLGYQGTIASMWGLCADLLGQKELTFMCDMRVSTQQKSESTARLALHKCREGNVAEHVLYCCLAFGRLWHAAVDGGALYAKGSAQFAVRSSILRANNGSYGGAITLYGTAAGMRAQC